MLDIPAAFTKLDREPIKQFRMGRRSALRAEVLERLDDALAEHELPEPVDKHARHERILRAHHPLSKVQTRSPSILDS